MAILTDHILPLNFEPEIGDLYETEQSKEVGFVVEKVRNRTGSVRLRLLQDNLETRWTTWVPA